MLTQWVILCPVCVQPAPQPVVARRLWILIRNFSIKSRQTDHRTLWFHWLDYYVCVSCSSPGAEDIPAHLTSVYEGEVCVGANVRSSAGTWRQETSCWRSPVRSNWGTSVLLRSSLRPTRSWGLPTGECWAKTCRSTTFNHWVGLFVEISRSRGV